jgi:hypothetical protein
MTGVADFKDDILSVGQGRLRLDEHGSGSGRYFMGDYMDPRGFVSVYMQDDYTRLDVIAVGRLVMRSWDRTFSRRTLPRLARQLLDDVANFA